MNKQARHPLQSSECGAVMVESALAVPVLLALTLATLLTFSILVNMMAMEFATREAAKYASYNLQGSNGLSREEIMRDLALSTANSYSFGLDLTAADFQVCPIRRCGDPDAQFDAGNTAEAAKMHLTKDFLVPFTNYRISYRTTKVWINQA
ncbi:pilus assembly protein [bacterium]|nr:pilus assembly protein [bacterium]